MATFNADRPAFSFSGAADTDLATTTAALANTPADFLSMDSGGVDLAASTVTTTNHSDDDLGCEIRIMNGATVLAAADSGGGWVTLAPTTAGPTSSINTNVIDFAYVNTTANKTTWDGASVEYRQRWVKNKGGDGCYVSSSAITNNITFTYTADTVDNLTATDIESASEFTTPAVGQGHQLLADNIESASNVTTPAAADVPSNVALTATDIESASNISTPAATHPWDNLPAPTEVESASEFTTPAIGQTHDFTATDIESASEFTTPAVNESNILLADNIESASEFTTPAVTQDHQLLADNIESASEFTTPAVTQDHQLLADNIESASEFTTPQFGQLVFLPPATEVESATNVSTPAATHIHVLTATDIESTSNVSTPAVVEDTQNELTATDIESASEVTTPSSTTQSGITAVDIQSASQVSTPAMTTLYALTASDIESASGFTTPEALQNSDTIRPDADTSVGNWTTHTGATTNLFQQIDEEAPPNDSDYIRSELNPQNSPARFSLSNLVDVHDISGNHIVRYRYGKDLADSQQIDLTVRLIETPGSTIATWTHINIGATLTTAEQFLSSGEKASITNYDNLFLEFEANAP